MKIIFQTPGYKASRRLVEFVSKKVQTLDQKHEHILEAHVYLKKVKSSVPDNRICEIRLVIPGNDLFASKQGETFEVAVAKAVDAIKRQIKNRKPENQVPTLNGIS